MTQNNRPLFQPAPRPIAKTSPADAQRLVEAAADLGFNRPSVGKDPNTHLPESADAQADLKPQALSGQAFAVPESVAAPKAARPEAPRAKARTQTVEKITTIYDQSIKVDVSDELWTALKMATIRRRVSMKFLLLEALEKAGYPVALDSVPEDGRRYRKSSVD
jgi:hypothetical protein